MSRTESDDADAELIGRLRRALDPGRDGEVPREREVSGVMGTDVGADNASGTGGGEAKIVRPISEAALNAADEILGQGGRRHGVSDGRSVGAAAPATKLAISAGGRVLSVPGEGVVLGRRPGPGGVIVDDGEVSREHARVVWHGTEICVVDLGSTNGTVVVRGEQQLASWRTAVPLVLDDRIVTSNGSIAGRSSR